MRLANAKTQKIIAKVQSHGALQKIPPGNLLL
jgi:hypothetical protein